MHLFMRAVSVSTFWLRVCYLVVDIGDDLMSRYDHSSWKSVIVQSRSFRVVLRLDLELELFKGLLDERNLYLIV